MTQDTEAKAKGWSPADLPANATFRASAYEGMCPATTLDPVKPQERYSCLLPSCKPNCLISRDNSKTQPDIEKLEKNPPYLGF